MSLLHEPGARPLKWGRIALHLGGGLCAAELVLRDALPMSWQHFTYSFTAMVVGTDLLRFALPSFNREVLKYVSAFAQQHEARRLTSASWFWVAMSIIATLAEREFFLATLVTLSVGDPAGSIVGRKVRSPQLVNGRTLAGTSAFVLSSLGMTALVFHRLGLPVGQSGLIVLLVGAALIGAVVELYASRIDDNLAIGLAVGLFYIVAGPSLLG